MTKAKPGITLYSTHLCSSLAHKIHIAYNHLFCHDWITLAFISASEHDSFILKTEVYPSSYNF